MSSVTCLAGRVCVQPTGYLIVLKGNPEHAQQRKHVARLTGIEAARGVAATTVVLYHVGRHLAKQQPGPLQAGIFQFGHSGVDLFFVLSGFIILFVHYNDVGRPGQISHYIGRRFTRVMPTYWVALAMTILLHYFGQGVMPTADALFWSISLLPSHWPLLLDPAWTLRYEIVFYAIFALFIWRLSAGLLLLTVWMVFVGLTVAGLVDAGSLPAPLHGAYDVEFVFGMVAAWLLHRWRMPAPRLLFVLGVVLFAGAALAEDAGWMDGYADVARIAYGGPAALIVLGVAAAEQQHLIRVPRGLQLLGSASYSIYLFQFVFIGIAWKLLLVSRLALRLPMPAVFVALALPGVCGGIAMSRLVEQPLLRAFRQSRRNSGQPARAA